MTSGLIKALNLPKDGIEVPGTHLVCIAASVVGSAWKDRAHNEVGQLPVSGSSAKAAIIRSAE